MRPWSGASSLAASRRISSRPRAKDGPSRKRVPMRQVRPPRPTAHPHTGSRRRVRQARPRPVPPRDGRPHLAEAWGLRRDGGNPCRFVQRYKEQKRERFLSDDEFRRMGRVLAETLAGVTAERGTNAALGGCRSGGGRTAAARQEDWCADGAVVQGGGERAFRPSPQSRNPLGHRRQEAGRSSHRLAASFAAHSRARQTRRCANSRFVAHDSQPRRHVRRESAPGRKASRASATPDHRRIRPSRGQAPRRGRRTDREEHCESDGGRRTERFGQASDQKERVQVGLVRRLNEHL